MEPSSMLNVRQVEYLCCYRLVISNVHNSYLQRLVLKGRLNSWVVSHLALTISTLRHALGHEFKPWWWQTLFWTQAQHLRFIHDSIWFIWFDTNICLLNLSCEFWNRKLKIKEIYFKKIQPSDPYPFNIDLLQLDLISDIAFANVKMFKLSSVIK